MSDTVRVLNLFTILNRGGAETMCMNLYRNIDRSKVQFDFLVYYSQRGAYEDEIEALGGHIYRIPHLKNLVAHIRGARQFFAEHKEISIVHDHMSENGALICREAKRAGVQSIIYHSHFEPVPIFGALPKLFCRCVIDQILFKIAMRNCNLYFACGPRAAKVFDSKLDVHILNNAINIEKYTFNANIRQSVREELHCGNSLVIGNVARLEVIKNQQFLLSVFKRIVCKYSESMLLLTGDGTLRSELEKQACDLGISDKVQFLGVRNDVNRILQGMDVFVFPSTMEGLGIAAVEAQAAGLPCFCNESLPHEVAVTNLCEFLPLDKPELWVKAILSAKTERRDMSEAVKAAGYDIKETSKWVQQFYLDCGRGTCEKNVV